ncbi:MAG TPA: formate dehydrogenase accessory protein FdhE [Candidatus Acidoferrales bacterium]|nr:formate dehydrogenase accessory protein FdhE [Candidatus Acidoferrales bacterium]
MMLQSVLDTRWSERRERASELAERWSFAAEVLSFYRALLEVQERAFDSALADRPSRDRIAKYASECVLPSVIETSVASGPPAMTESVLSAFHETELEPMIDAWLHGEDLTAVERYLARASAGPVLEALSSSFDSGGAGDNVCPKCGGSPQLSYFAPSEEDLVTSHRHLLCSRCAWTWKFPRLTCASCGEMESKALTIYGEIGTTQAELSENIIKARGSGAAQKLSPAQFPHMRVDGCKTCSKFLLSLDLERDRRSVPLVDEIAAIPLSLYAVEHGLSKIVPNLMGF